MEVYRCSAQFGSHVEKCMGCDLHASGVPWETPPTALALLCVTCALLVDTPTSRAHRQRIVQVPVMQASAASHPLKCWPIAHVGAWNGNSTRSHITTSPITTTTPCEHMQDATEACLERYRPCVPVTATRATTVRLGPSLLAQACASQVATPRRASAQSAQQGCTAAPLGCPRLHVQLPAQEAGGGPPGLRPLTVVDCAPQAPHVPRASQAPHLGTRTSVQRGDGAVRARQFAASVGQVTTGRRWG